MLAIAGMIILSLCLNSEQLIISDEVEEKAQNASVMIYCVIAFFQTIDNKNPERNRLLSIVKFILIYVFSACGNGIKLVLSTIALLAGIYFARAGKIVEDIDKILYTEILLLSAETFVITVCTIFSIIKGDICALFESDPQFWTALISIVLCFFFRAHRLEKDNIHYTPSGRSPI